MNNLTWQYVVVVLLIIAALARMIYGIRKSIKKKGGGSCCGCSLSEQCSDYRKPKDQDSDKPHCNTQKKNSCCK